MSPKAKPQRPFWFAPTNNIIHIGKRPDPQPFEQIAALARRAELSMPHPAPRIHALEDATLAELVRLASQPLPALTVDEEREVLAMTTRRRTRKSPRRTNAIERHVRALVASGATLSRRGRGVRLSLRPEAVDGMLAAAQPPRRHPSSALAQPGVFSFDPRHARRSR